MQRLLLLILLIPALGFGQQKDSTARTTDSLKFAKVEVESEFPGGAAGWQSYLIKNMRYPVKAMKKRIQGMVVIQFIIDKQGRVSDVEAVEGPEMLAEEGVRLIKASGKWIPATQDGIPVKSYKKQPFVFKLEY